MRQELLASQKSGRGILLDPRTKLALLITISVFVLSGGAMLEYRLVPVIMCSVKIGEELSAAALTRGLGGSVKRTNICEIGFHVQDILFLLLCVVAFAIPIATMIAGR